MSKTREQNPSDLPSAAERVAADHAAAGRAADHAAIAAHLRDVRTLDETPTSLALRFFTCDASAEIRLYHSAGAGASWRRRAQATLEALRAECERLEGLLSRFPPTSDIARVNAAGGRPVRVSPETAAVVRAALGYCARSAGRFDITIAPAAALWNFHRETIADPRALEAACAAIDWRRVTVADGDDGPWISLGDPRAALDLGGIAKGWIADALAARLRAAGHDDFLINLGGNVLVEGSPGAERPWTIAIRDPRARERSAGTVRLRSGAVVTSGTSERSFVADGVLHHHILDPASGRPVDTDVTSATVIAARAIDAEGFSTTLVALGVKRGLAFAETQPEIVQALFIDRDGRLHSSCVGQAMQEERKSRPSNTP